MDRSEKIGLGVAVAAHAALLAALSSQWLAPPEPIKMASKPMEVSIADAAALQSTAPKLAKEAPPPAPGEEKGAPEEGAAAPPPAAAPQAVPHPAPKPAPQPAPRPEPRPTPPKAQPKTEPKPTPRPSLKPAPKKPEPRPEPKAPAKPSPKPTRPAAKPSPAKPSPAKPSPAKPSPSKAGSAHSTAAKPAPARATSASASGSSAKATTRTGTAASGNGKAAKSRGSLRLDTSDWLKSAAHSNTSTAAKPSAGAPASAIGPAQKSALDAEIRRQLKPHWKAPTGADVEQLRTILTVRLARDGSLAGAPQVVTTEGVTASNRTQVRLHQEQAIKAVRLAAPFRLPADLYPGWNFLRLTFDKRLSQ